MVAQHHFARRHTRNSFNTLPDFLPDAGREFRWAKWAGQVKVTVTRPPSICTLSNRPIRQRARISGSRCASRFSYRINSIIIAIPSSLHAVRVAGCEAGYARLRCAISSFWWTSVVLGINAISPAILSPMIFRLFSSVNQRHLRPRNLPATGRP